MRADDQLCVSLSNVAADFALAVALERTSQQNNPIPGGLENLSSRKVVLLGQNLRRSHERNLVSVFDSDDGGFEGHKRLAGAHIALQQTAHGIRLFHVRGDFFEGSLLRSCGMEGQNSLDRLTHAILQLEFNSRLRLLLTPLQFEP